GEVDPGFRRGDGRGWGYGRVRERSRSRVGRDLRPVPAVLQPLLQPLADGRPFVHQDAVHHGVADAAVAAGAGMSDYAITICSELLDGLLRIEVQDVRAQTHHFA